ncbi:hypothetical protein [Pseudescherichia sp. L3]|uniref:hypothetical protein n=1 Tax=Pseudescherichia sp. L3 TaxID=2970817 RepID=UPI0021500091|nr:hypothetical protein [Pseudescherichia sp. L3]MCR4457895.1 hypothetical protein [Pseudescherichia sp. L3]
MLIEDYKRILTDLKATSFDLAEDKYSGIFLPVPFDEYWQSNVKIMLVGRETAGWNTKNNKNSIARALGLVPGITVETVIEEAVARYRQHLDKKPNGTIKLKSRSRFKQYYFRLARELQINPKAIVYANLFAWDYAKKTPLDRPATELTEVTSISLRLLAAQIRYLQPDFMIFAAGISRADSTIKKLFTEHLEGYQTSAPVISGRLWEFKSNNTTCFRIAHPRAGHGHEEYRSKVIERIKHALRQG